MIDRKALLTDLIKQVKAAEADLARQVRAVDPVRTRLRAEYDRARELGRTAATWNSWLDERITQVAAAWVLGTVFVRFCEDNRLIPEPWLAGPDVARRELAEARYDAYVETDDDPTYRGWLERTFAELGAGQAGRALFDRTRNPLYQIPLSHDGARDLVAFWRERSESGELVHDFTDPLSEDGTAGWDTRFLGDLYQDLSEAARKTYALLQTPEFVEEFILDRAMDPAVREFGVAGLRMIDPTCGSGHFVLGAFRRLVRRWAEKQPHGDPHERVRAALDSVHGVDINPFAVAIARFRLLVAAMAAAGVRTLAEAARYEWPLHLAVGDSLIKARQLELTLVGEESGDELAEFAYATEDIHEPQFKGILEPGRYHVVVGNPPYITVKDKKLNALYRGLYDACVGPYPLSVPFMQRFFDLVKKGEADGTGFGLAGQITSNSFMKREFGNKLIEDYLGHQVELKEVIDTSGSYIPGHGTPTVILIGSARKGVDRSATIRTVRSIQGEPATPSRAEAGLVWNAIVGQIDRPGSVSTWVSVDDLARDRYFGSQPWILAANGREMVERIESAAASRLGKVVADIGTGAVPREHEAYEIGAAALRRHGIPERHRRPIVAGNDIRDYLSWDAVPSIWPYSNQSLRAEASEPIERFLWPFRTQLGRRVAFGKTQLDRGLRWFEYSMFFVDRYRVRLSIAVAVVATHSHFLLDRERKVFKQSAPVIKLREQASEGDHVRMLAVLNSSTACLWLKMVSHNKGGGGIGGGIAAEHWEQFYEFTGAKLQEFPLPAAYPTALATALDALAQDLFATSPSALTTPDSPIPAAASLREAKAKWHSTRARMIALQEELDWQVYSLYDLHAEDLRAPEADVPELALGERAFEIVLARRVEHGEASDEWFKRHGSTPLTDIPDHWPDAYKATVQKRIDAIASSRAIGMVERPEYKRRWATEGWDVLQHRALRAWLLDRIEVRKLWYDDTGQPVVRTLGQLTDTLSRDEDFVSIAALYEPHRALADVVAGLMTDEHVPYLAALHYKPTGLRKRADWEYVWERQREEDAAPDEPQKRKIRDSIPVPPKYTSADFRRPSYWRARGKLDVPKERFVSYPTAEAPNQPTAFGWAGWDHREQAQALTVYLTDRANNHAATTEELIPLLAGVLELEPWLHQWHHDYDATYGGSPADFFTGYRAQISGERGLTEDDLRAWQPPAATRGRRATTKKTN